MAKDALVSLKHPVHRIQIYLLDGIHNENQLLAAGSLMSKSDYQDVTTERSIAKTCGYPLCSNALASDQSGRKGRYRISLKEHKVYDLKETHMFCSTKCLIDSRAFLGTLQEERCSVFDSRKIDETLKLFDESSGGSGEGGLGKNGDLGFSELRIRENEDVKHGEVITGEWIGPTNAIEGYVPRLSKPSDTKNKKEVVKSRYKKPAEKIDLKFNEFDFTSTILTQDEYSVSKQPSQLTAIGYGPKIKNSEREVDFREVNDQFATMGTPSDHTSSRLKTKFEEPNQEKNVVDMIDNLSISEVSDGVCQSGPGVNVIEAKKGPHTGKSAESNAGMLKPSLRSLNSKNVARSVTWADEKSAGNKKLTEVSELEDTKKSGLDQTNTEEYDSLRVTSAEACALALSQAAEAVASGDSDVPDAVSEAGVIVMPPPIDEEPMDMDMDVEPTAIKWPKKQGITHSDFFADSDSWYDDAPEGFGLNLSPFATMFMALFSWMSSSSLAYIYGRDECSHEEYLSVNGREYPRRVIAMDGRSSEIRQTIAGCLARTLPGLAGDLRLPIPISTLEKGMSCLLGTMSFMDPIPPFRLKQWQVIVLLFIDALSVSRVPSIAPYMISMRRFLHKVLDDAKISAEEYEIMKDIVIPLGRVPHLSAQSGG